jgi:hypothetical protein
LNAKCSDVNKEALELETYVSVVCISRWGAKDIKIYNELLSTDEEIPNGRLSVR